MSERIALLLRVRGHPHDRHGDQPSHFSVIHEELNVGTVYLRTSLADDDEPWFWSVTVPLAKPEMRVMATSGRDATREGAMRAFRHSFERVLAAIGEKGWSDFREHMRRISR